MEEKYIEKIVSNESSVKSAHKRIDKLENEINDIHDLTCSVKAIASEIKLMREDVNKIDTRVECLEKEPLQNYKDLKKSTVKQIVNFIVGAILAGLAVYVFK